MPSPMFMMPVEEEPHDRRSHVLEDITQDAHGKEERGRHQGSRYSTDGLAIGAERPDKGHASEGRGPGDMSRSHKWLS